MSSLLDEKRLSPVEEEPLRPRPHRTLHLLAAVLAPIALLAFVLQLHPAFVYSTTAARPAHLHPHTSPAAAAIDWSWLAPEKQCPGLQGIGQDEFTARRTQLAELLKGEDGKSWGAYVSEPGPNTLYYANLTQSDWYLSERPWLLVITPSTSDTHSSRLSILTPSFEVSRSQRLPFALSSAEFESVSWVAWEEAEDPYATLVAHLEELRGKDGINSEGWSIHLEENVRQFVASGLAAAVKEKEGVEVGLASIEVRQQRMRKTKAELNIQHCVAKITRVALRAVREHLRIGMTEKEGEALIVNALTAGGLKDLGAIVLFGANAALPHASASVHKRLEHGEFALFDVDGSLHGYMSDFTRTMLPDIHTRSCHGFGKPKILQQWPSARAEKIWKTVHKAQEAALAALVNQNDTHVVYATDADRAARGVIAEEGWEKYFTHRLGHGIGLQVHEEPYLNSGNTHQPLLSGFTFSNEPGIYIREDEDTEGNGIGVRLEDMVLKTERGWSLVAREELAKSPWEP
ncbi:peptidase M24, structural domain-containing protein [Leucosporidium creatinivorum]|uniref:Peptidase M24, structural domain-containing protein n=1 Tax=Leucosporidium creatinivorum TaxID=106004 RepID=A0A1Y2FXV1_9BASI|nr:peptidase M24, structural domain-containing protein [Leucosporidium creatinivorum]